MLFISVNRNSKHHTIDPAMVIQLLYEFMTPEIP